METIGIIGIIGTSFGGLLPMSRIPRYGPNSDSLPFKPNFACSCCDGKVASHGKRSFCVWRFSLPMLGTSW